MIVRVFKKVIQAVTGKPSEFETEQKHYITSVFVGLVVALISVIINIRLGFGPTIQVVISLSFIGLLWLYWKARWQKVFFIWGFIILGLIVLSISWIYNEGPAGSINYLYLLAIIAFLSIAPRTQHYKVILTVLFNLVILYFIYFFFPAVVVPYPNASAKELDIISTFFYTSFFSVLIFINLRINYQNEKQKAEMSKDEMELQNKLFTESIVYARDIQKGLLQSEKDLKNYFDEVFVFWQPKDIIGGDFYSFIQPNKYADRIYCVLSDCTGHGVPGALLTMLGLSFTSEVIHRNSEITSDEVLSQLRHKIKHSLTQGRVATDSRDGMDIAVCVIDKAKRVLQYSGANRPVFIIREKRIIELLPNRFPVGFYHFEEKPFNSHIISLYPGDTIFMFTDGYADQYGGPDNRKFLIARFKRLLIAVNDLPLSEQLEIIVSTFFEWKDLEEQTDDVLVVGFKPILA
jgi:serine phosphatase RsbU (regulator of sigma subunit)